MTIRRSINIEQARRDYVAFCEGVESAPEGTFQRAREIYNVIDTTMDTMFAEARDVSLALDNSDGAMEIEIAIFDMICTKNNADTEIQAAIGLGRTLLDYPETRRRVLDGLVRDRDFLRSRETAA